MHCQVQASLRCGRTLSLSIKLSLELIVRKQNEYGKNELTKEKMRKDSDVYITCTVSRVRVRSNTR